MSRFYGPDQIGLRFTWGSIRLEFRETRAMSSPLGGGGLVRRRVNLADLDPRSDEASDHASAGRIQRFECGPGIGRQKGAATRRTPIGRKYLRPRRQVIFAAFEGRFIGARGASMQMLEGANSASIGRHVVPVRATIHWCPRGHRER